MSRPALQLNSVRLISIFLFTVTLIAAPISAQTVTGTLQGTVLDATGSALPGATVTIQNTNTDFANASFGAITGTVNTYAPRTYQAAIRYQY